MQKDDFTLEWLIDFISNRIRLPREAKGVSAQTMSLDLGQNVSYINKIENKATKPSIEGFYNICEYLNVDFNDFFNTEIEFPDKTNKLFYDRQRQSL